MKTNYNNLNFFEVSVVAVAAIGLVLIGIQIYLTLPKANQAQLSNAFNILDIHESFGQAVGTTDLVVGSMQEFYNQFDIAFEQTFSFPDAIGEPVILIAQAVGDYSDSVGSAYTRNNMQTPSADLGDVLGAFITTQETQMIQPAFQAQQSQHIYKKYYYHAPTMVQKIIK